MSTIPELSPSARVIGITTLLDEAQALLPAVALRQLVLAVRRSLNDAERERIPAGTDAWISSLRPDIVESAKVYLRPIELLVHAAGEGSPVLSKGQIWQIGAYLDEIVERPTRARISGWQPTDVPATAA